MMRIFLRFFQLLALVLWLGGLFFFVIVAGVAFGVLPSTHLAGLVVTGSLVKLHHMGMVCAIVLLLCVALLPSRSRRWRMAQAAFVLLMLIGTAVVQDKIMPQMERDGAQAGGDIMAVPKDNPAREDFDHLHNWSSWTEMGVMACGLVVLALIAGDREPNGMRRV
jgi:hypothetical protein